MTRRVIVRVLFIIVATTGSTAATITSSISGEVATGRTPVHGMKASFPTAATTW